MNSDNEAGFLWTVIVWPLQFIVHILGIMRDVLVISIPLLGKVIQGLLGIVTSILLFFMEILDKDLTK